MPYIDTSDDDFAWVTDLDELQEYRARGRIVTNRFDAANQANPYGCLASLVTTLDQSCVEMYREPSRGMPDYQQDPALRLLALKLLKYCGLPVDETLWSATKAACKARMKEVA
jgi:hypothetical protein